MAVVLRRGAPGDRPEERNLIPRADEPLQSGALERKPRLQVGQGGLAFVLARPGGAEAVVAAAVAKSYTGRPWCCGRGTTRRRARPSAVVLAAGLGARLDEGSTRAATSTGCSSPSSSARESSSAPPLVTHEPHGRAVHTALVGVPVERRDALPHQVGVAEPLPAAIRAWGSRALS